MERRPARGVRRADQLRMCLERPDHPVLVASLEGIHEPGGDRRRQRRERGRFGTTVFLFFDDADDLVVAPLAARVNAVVAPRCGQIPLRASAPCCIKKATMVRTPPQHRMVQRSMLSFSRDIQVARAPGEPRPSTARVEVAATHRVDQPRTVMPATKPFSFGQLSNP